MRWIWIDKFTGFESGQSATTIKNVSMAEEHLHDHYPDFPIVPHSLIIEGFAQTAGLLVGEARQFKEKVILAKVSKAIFHSIAKPGDVITFQAKIEQISDSGATTSGHVLVNDKPLADIQMMFSHIDQNMQGLAFPKHNFVFTDHFRLLLDNYKQRSDITL